MNNLDWDEILNRLSQLATSQGGRDRLRRLQPLATAELAEASFKETFDAMEVLAMGRRPFMESLDLFTLWHQRLAKGATLKTLELRDLRHFCLEVLALKEILHDHQNSWAQSLTKSLMDSTEPLSAIDQIMTPDGEIRSDASQTLFQLFNEKNQTVRQTQSILDRLIRQHEMEPVLQDRYVTNREGRWVLPVRSGRQHAFEGIIHASSQSKQTVFMEPKEIIPLNNRLRQIEVDIEEEIERLLRQLSEYLETRLGDFLMAQEVMLAADTRFAQGQLATQLGAHACRFSSEEMVLRELKHPLLILSGHDVIANSVELRQDRRLLLLSGPNAGGKTVLLKAVGLAAQMARCGLLVSAQAGSCLPFFTEVHVAVGDSQSVDQHLSTFAAHLRILDTATRSLGPSTLLLIDEICGSTDPEEGSALARAFIQAYARNGSFGVITSHLGPLKLGWKPGSGVVNGSLEYDTKSGRPTYQFLMGIAGQSLALQTARRVGVSGQILEEAVNFLSPEMKQYHLGLTEVEEMKDELRRQRDQAQLESKAAAAQKAEYTSLLNKLEREKQDLLTQTVRQAEKKIESMLDQVKVEDVFRRHERLEQIKHEMPEIVKASPRATSVTRVETPEDFARVFPPGSKVFAVSIGRDAVVQGQPNAKGDVPVLSHSMRLLVPWTQLRAAQNASNPTVEVVRRAGESASASLDQDRQVDVRGRSLDEALAWLDTQLDTAVLHKESRIKIVHGHGTDTLKKGIRNYLSRSIYVKKWKAGTPETGGDGVTWVEIRD